MKIEMIRANEKNVMVLADRSAVITDENTALDVLIASNFSAGTHLLAIRSEALAEAFFKPKTGFAESVLKQYTSYGLKCAVFGDLGRYANSKPMQEFIRKKNKENEVYFAKDLESAVEWLVRD